MSELDATMTVNDIIRRWPAAANVLGHYGLDLCCGGVLPLNLAAASAGVDPAELVAALEEATRANPQRR